MNIDEFRKKIIRDVDGFMNSYAIRKFFFDDNMDYKAWPDLFNEYLEDDE